MKTVRIIIAVALLMGFLLFVLPMTYFMGKTALSILRDVRASDPATQDVDPVVSDSDTDLQLAIEVQEDIANNRVRLGMTADQVRESWGKPEDVNRTVTRWGTHEQWIYGPSLEATYLYFDGGVLTSVQD